MASPEILSSRILSTADGFEFAYIETVQTEYGPVTEVVWTRDIPGTYTDIPDHELPY